MEVERIINERYQECKRVLTENKEKVEQLAEALLEKEVLDLSQIIDIVGPKPFPMSENL